MPFVQNHAANLLPRASWLSWERDHLRTALRKPGFGLCRTPLGSWRAGTGQPWPWPSILRLPPFSHTSGSWPPLCSCFQSRQREPQTTHPAEELKVLGRGSLRTIEPFSKLGTGWVEGDPLRQTESLVRPVPTALGDQCTPGCRALTRGSCEACGLGEGLLLPLPYSSRLSFWSRSELWESAGQGGCGDDHPGLSNRI